MRYEINEKRNRLTVIIDDEERQTICEMQSDGKNIGADSVMCDFLEPLTCNSELEWIDPVEARDTFGDLTDAPMLGIYGVSDETRSNGGSELCERWAFMEYETVSVLETLRDTGKAVFISGE